MNNNKHVTVSEDPSLTFGMTLELWSGEGERSSDSKVAEHFYATFRTIAASFPLLTHIYLSFRALAF